MPENRQERFLDELWRRMNVRDKDSRFIQLYAEPDHDPLQWTAFFSTVDLPQEPYPFNCLLTRLDRKTKWQGVPDELVPMLSGLKKKLIAKNAVQMMDGMMLVKELNRRNIPVLLIKGGALRTVLLPDVPRRMTDLDIVVPADRYKESYETALANGYHTVSNVMYSIDLHKGDRSTVDIHHSMFKNNFQTDEPAELILNDASEHQRNGAVFKVPSPEDTFLMTMINAVDNFLQGSDKGPVTWLADCLDIAERYPLHYETMMEHARAFHVWPQFQTGVLLMQRFLPGHFSELHRITDTRIHTKTIKRMERLLKCRDLTQEELKGKPLPVRAWHRIGFLSAYYIGIHHLDDSTITIIRAFPGMLKEWQRVDRASQLPHAFLNTAVRWKKERKEA